MKIGRYLLGVRGVSDAQNTGPRLAHNGPTPWHKETAIVFLKKISFSTNLVPT